MDTVCLYVHLSMCVHLCLCVYLVWGICVYAYLCFAWVHLCMFWVCVSVNGLAVQQLRAPWWQSTGGSGVKEGEFRVSVRERGERTWTKERLIESALLRHWTHIWLVFLSVCVVNCVPPMIHDVCMCVTKALTLENLSKSCLIKRDYKENLTWSRFIFILG